MIDKEKGLAYVAGDEELYKEVLEEFVEEANEDIANITKAYQDGEISQYIVLVHALKSTSLTMGALELSERAKSHEFAGKESRLDDIHADFDGLIQLYRDTIAEIKNMLD